MFEALKGAVCSLCEAAKGNVRAIIDAIPVDDLTDDKARAWKRASAVTPCKSAYQCWRQT